MGDVEKVASAVFSPVTYVADEAFFAPGRRQARIAEDQARVQREQRDVSRAMQERERQLAIRQQARQERIRRAQIVSAAEAAGVSGSSVEASTIGSGQTIGAAGQAFASGMNLGNEQISSLQQQFANLGAKSAEVAATGQMYRTGVDLGMKALSFGAFGAGGSGATSQAVQSGVNLDWDRFSNIG